MQITKINIITEVATKRSIEAIDVTQSYAVHTAQNKRKQGFSVTHKYSGISVWRTMDIQKALAVAMFLEKHNYFPRQATAEQLIELVKENSRLRSDLARELERIAPLIGEIV